MAKVKEVREKISDLLEYKRNLVNLQEYFLGHIATDEDVSRIASIIQEDADMSITIRNLSSATARVVDEEIQRLEKLVDEAEVAI